MTRIKSVVVGSMNPIKVDAVGRVLARYASLERAKVRGVAIPSGVGAQPQGLDEIWAGAANRAKGAWHELGANLGVGLESGVFVAPWGVLDACACVLVAKVGALPAVVGFGLSSAFEVPPGVLEAMRGGLEMCDAFAKAGHAPADFGRVGTGASGVCTRDRVTRAHQVEQAVTMALSKLDHPKLYA